jgi:hypothetical protein
VAEAGDVFIKLHLHNAVLFERMHFSRLGFTRLDKAQRLGDRHLKNQDLIFLQRCFRNSVAGLDKRRLGGFFGRLDAGDIFKETADRHGVGGIVGPLIDDLQHVLLTYHAGSNLNTAGAPAVRHRHLTTGERHLIAGDRHGLQNSSADHALGLLV